MSHTCYACGTSHKVITAPTVDGYEVISSKFDVRINRHYHHELRSQDKIRADIERRQAREWKMLMRSIGL